MVARANFFFLFSGRIPHIRSMSHVSDRRSKIKREKILALANEKIKRGSYHYSLRRSIRIQTTSNVDHGGRDFRKQAKINNQSTRNQGQQ